MFFFMILINVFEDLQPGKRCLMMGNSSCLSPAFRAEKLIGMKS